MRPLLLLAAATLIGLGAHAQTPTNQDHQAHHPDGAGASAPTPRTTPPSTRKAPPRPATAASVPSPSQMRETMQSMQDMHDKMAAAKTPEERQALMAEHMKAMQDGMAMMGRMKEGRGRMGGMNGMGGMGGMSERHDAMGQRMEMMELMMQMMLDREAARAPAK